MQISATGIEHIKRWEGLRLDAYQDGGGVWTIGYGHTLNVGPGQTISAEQAEAYLITDLEWAQDAVNELVSVPLSQHQFDALVSFVFNVGRKAFADSTLRRLLNAGDYDAVPAQLARWVHDNGARVQGLVNRRAAEAGLWAKGEHVSSRGVGAAPPPPEKPLVKAETVATAATAAGGVIASLSGVEGPLAYALAGVVAIGGLAAVILIARRYWREGKA